MHRYKITIEYDGEKFHGWQAQEGQDSVQSSIENAIEKIRLKLSSRLIVAGRTDAGVHALNQVAHFDCEDDLLKDKFVSGVNHFLKNKRIVIKDIDKVDDDFHARFSAKSRSYLYRIINRTPALLFDRGRAWHVKHRLNIEEMKRAAELIEGLHDFQSFRATGCQAKNAIRRIDRIEISKAGDLIEISVDAKSFLHNQIRIIVGTLYEVGIERWPAESILQIFDARDRRAAGRTAPACGLFLSNVQY